MNRLRYVAVIVGAGSALAAPIAACGGSKPSSFEPGVTGGGDAAASSVADAAPPPPLVADSSLGEGGCPTGKQTSITGKVYDPKGSNPLYNVAVYAPSGPLVPLPRGLLQGADACNCESLFPTSAYASALTGPDGAFSLSTNLPLGDVQIVAQIGKWRRVLHVQVDACQENEIADHTFTLPRTIAPGDTDDSMPDIAVSTGAADSLECLLDRVGVSAAEFSTTPGDAAHVHLYAGGSTGATGSSVGLPGPESSSQLWGTSSQLAKYDLVFLSCEAGPTYDANPLLLEAYLNAGGRVFASHYHYSWFSGEDGATGTDGGYAAPADWANLATWYPLTHIGPAIIDPTADIVQTLSGSAAPFPKGEAMKAWLEVVGATTSPTSSEIALEAAHWNVDVAPQNTAQPWLVVPGFDGGGATMYLSFNTPVGAPLAPDGGPPQYCGRAVFSPLHVGTGHGDHQPAPAGCDSSLLSAQEKALEFMLFDLSSCVTPDTSAPPVPVPIPK